MKTFLENLRTELQAKEISEDIIEEIIKDHEEMIETARAEGISDEEISGRFGEPRHIADEIAEFEVKKQHSEDDRSGEKLYTFDTEKGEIRVLTNLVGEDTTYQTLDSEQIMVKIIGKGNLSKYLVSFEDGLLKIEIRKRHGYRFGFLPMNSQRVIVSIPKKLHVKSLIHNSVNADLNFQDLRLGDVEIKTIEGDLTYENNQSQTLKIHSVNGDLNFREIKAQNLSISTVDGDVKVSKVDLGLDLVMETVNGELTVNNTTAKNLSIRTVGGDVNLHEVEIKVNLSVESASGNLSAQDSKAESFYYHTLSGDAEVKEFYPKNISLSSVSGNINILNKKNEPIKIIKKKTLSGQINFK